MMVALTNFVLLYVHEGTSVIATLIVLTCQLFIGQHIVYLRPLGGKDIVGNLFMIVGSLAGSTLYSTVPIYVNMLHKTLRLANQSQVKLLNGMHEGLMILGVEVKPDDN